MGTTLTPQIETRLEDLEWMAKCGESRIRAARRLGLAPRSLDRVLYRAGRADLRRALAQNDPTILLPHEENFATPKTRRTP